MKTGPIIIIDDDAEDRQLFIDVLNDLQVKNAVLWFAHSLDALDYLRNTSDQPFVIFSDINLPGVNGIEFKRRIDEDVQLRKKSIPFVFYSTSVNPNTINEAYTQMTVQGYFQKSNKYAEIKQTIKAVLDYWSVCVHPNAL